MPIRLVTRFSLQMTNEKKLRVANTRDKDGFARTIGSFHGVNIAAGRDFPGTPLFNTPPAGRNILANGAPSDDRGQESPTTHTESLAKWVSAIKPDSVPQFSPQQARLPLPLDSRTRAGEANSEGSAGVIYEAASRLDNHNRHDSSAASCWQGGAYVSEAESSENSEGGDSRASFAGTGRIGKLSHSEWNGQDPTIDFGRTDGDFGRTIDDLGSTSASSTFFNDLAAPLQRSSDAFGVMHEDDDDDGDHRDHDNDRNIAISPGRMTEAASAMSASPSRFRLPRRGMDDTIGGHGEAMSRWDGSPPSHPAGASINMTCCSDCVLSCNVPLFILSMIRVGTQSHHTPVLLKNNGVCLMISTCQELSYTPVYDSRGGGGD